MASSFPILLIFSITIGLFSISATARPCKTITFFIPNPNSNSNNNNNNPHRFTFFITEIHRTTSFPLTSQNDVVSSSKPYSSSIRDHTMDIMSGLLFGVGCGALTAATMYLIWSLLSNRTDDVEYDNSDDDVEDDVSKENKKMNGECYVAVPVKEVPPTADEIDAMK